MLALEEALENPKICDLIFSLRRESLPLERLALRNTCCSTFPCLSKNFTRLTSFAHSVNPWIFTTFRWWRNDLSDWACDSQCRSSPELGDCHRSLFHSWWATLSLRESVDMGTELNLGTYLLLGAAVANDHDGYGVEGGRAPEYTC